MNDGTIIRGRYQIERMLGSGGYGITYLALDKDLPSHPKCVVKQLNIQSKNPNVLSLAREMFEREAKVLERLGEKHDQIPKLLAQFEEKGEFYLVQEFIDGHDLSHEITSGNCLSQNKVIALLQDILQVLDFVHRHNVIHRDIKPSNLIRRSFDDKIIMIDFGVVKEISTLVGLKGEVSITGKVGTSGYMPTEQENGNPRQSSDIYAVGIVAIQALTGLHPCSLEKDTSGNLMWRKHALRVNNTLALVLDEMVHQNFELRYKSAMETLIALNEAIKSISTIPLKSTQHTGEHELPSTPSSHKSLVPNLIKNQASFSLIIFSFLLSLISVFYSFSSPRKPQVETTPTPKAIPLPMDEPKQPYENNEVKINLNDVCQEDFIYKDTEEMKNKIPIHKIGLQYRNDLNNVWPIFRWACLYERRKKNPWEITQRIPWGLDLDEYCRRFYPDKPKASHHDYKDRNSLYCTRPHP
ncbi:hypothetical protein BV372_22950 [Nostoc sp. T09]|uniref:serine/threonine-protein kinase n=1 Tax=Nostoc sp. T09 TaxID=1932621 RepID=UPI000A360165|nr:serine/threonine-protein kinase [Nostoc sp. T09]OUL29602.1 hypothetical protein BV372_22950 [Nostoc sp. T09]